jgi:uncharacterized membrane protein (DUF485 family)
VTEPGSLQALQSARARVVTALSAATALVYFGFILLVAFVPVRLGALLAPGLSLGIVLGASVIVLSWLFTALYVRWANKRYDPALRELRRKPNDG